MLFLFFACTTYTPKMTASQWNGVEYGSQVREAPGSECKMKKDHSRWLCLESINGWTYEVSYLVKEDIFWGTLINCRGLHSCGALYAYVKNNYYWSYLSHTNIYGVSQDRWASDSGVEIQYTYNAYTHDGFMYFSNESVLDKINLTVKFEIEIEDDVCYEP